MTKRIASLVLVLAMVLSMGIFASAESSELVTITIMRDENPMQPITADNAKIKAVEAALNIHLDIQAPPKASYAEKKQVLIMTDDMPDMMLVDFAEVQQYARDDMFVNLSEHRDQLPNLFAILDQPAYSTLTVDGQYYSVPTIGRASKWDSISGQLVNVRKDLFEKYNLGTPTTWDELTEAIKVILANEPGMVGITNRKGGSTTATRKLMDCMAYPLGAGSDMYYDEDQGGVWLYGPTADGFKAVLTTLNKMYTEGVLDPDYAIMTKDLWTEKMSSGVAVCTVDNNGVVDNMNAALKTVNPDYEIGVIPTLTNSLGQTRNFCYSVDHLTEAWVIATSSEKIDTCLKFLDWCFTEEGADVNGYGMEGVTYYKDEEGNCILFDSILEQYSVNAATAYYDMESALGIGLLDVAPWNDNGQQYQMSLYLMGTDEAKAAYMEKFGATANDAGLRQPITAPALDENQTERYVEIHTAVENIIWQEVDKFITGQEPIENWDKVVEKANAAGAAEMVEIYNAAWNK